METRSNVITLCFLEKLRYASTMLFTPQLRNQATDCFHFLLPHNHTSIYRISGLILIFKNCRMCRVFTQRVTYMYGTANLLVPHTCTGILGLSETIVIVLSQNVDPLLCMTAFDASYSLGSVFLGYIEGRGKMPLLTDLAICELLGQYFTHKKVFLTSCSPNICILVTCMQLYSAM